MQKICIMLLFVCGIFTAALAQQKNVWENKGLGFESKSALIIKGMDVYNFNADNAQCSVDIMVFQDERSNPTGLRDAVQELAKSMEFSNLSEPTTFDKNGLVGYYLTAQSGDLTSAFVCLQNIKTNDNFIIIFNCTKGNEALAIPMVESIFLTDITAK